ncbi:hypothetical protein FORMB_07950 [Formosa sp. Hel1_33_131]|nr:hypothetical protein FORMB_07950 [Formosa sp. Hel1_33_131]
MFLQISEFLDNYNVFVAILLDNFKTLLSIFEFANTNNELSH